jgi:uncharacterized protein YhaN
MGGFLQGILERLTQNKRDEVDIVQQARDQIAKNVTEAKDEQDTEPHYKFPQLKTEVDLNDPRDVWFLSMAAACQRKQHAEDKVTKLRQQLNWWQDAYDAHVAARENTRVFDWRENDKNFKAEIALLHADLKDAVHWARQRNAEYANIMSHEDDLFQGRIPRSSGQNEGANLGGAQQTIWEPLDLDA